MPKTRTFALLAALGAATLPSCTTAGPSAASPARPTAADPRVEEAAIRALVARAQTEPRLIRRADDAIFVSGLYPRPIIYREGRPVENVQPISEARAEQRRNVQFRDEIVRLEVAAAGDMAYEFGNSTGSFDMADTNEHQSFTASYLRVWKKVNGEWRVAAHFIRPNRT